MLEAMLWNAMNQQKNNAAFNEKYIEYKCKGSKKLSIKQYLEKVKDLSNMIDNSGQQKIHLIMKDNDDKQLMHSKYNNTKIMISNKTDEIFNELFQSLFTRFKLGPEKSMKGSEFFFDDSIAKCFANIIE